MSEVSLEEVRRVAELANLKLTAAEEPRMQRDLNAILGHIAELAELDTTGVEPMAQVSDLFGDRPRNSPGDLPGDDGGPVRTLRMDRVSASLPRPAVMASAPETDGRFFKVPRVIER